MRYALVLASTYVVGASAFVGACSSSNSTPGGGDGGATSSTTAASSSSTTAASSSATAASSSATAASSSGGAGTCAAGAGTVHTELWDFKDSDPTTVGGGKGQVLSIHVCDTIQWMNDDMGVPHSVVGTSPNAMFINTPVVTGAASPGTPLSPVQFTQAGTFTYWCGVHTTMMIGQVTVQ